jgi:membrane protease YdiL (CAAX protease family)
MKSCPWCGKEYPDDSTICFIDGKSLLDNEPQLCSEKPKLEPPPDEHAPYLAFPDYQWSARDAWKCLGMVLVFEIVLPFVNRALKVQFPDYFGGGIGYFLRNILHYSICLLVAAYFARTESLTSFWKGFGLDRKPSNYVWFAVVMALIIRFFGHFMLIHGWGKGVFHHDLNSFRSTLGIERYFFLAPSLILAPLFEESIYRGFVYKAFRGSYSIVVGMALIVAWTAITHWAQYSKSLLAAFDLSVLTIVQCYLRDKSDSLWDCIFCHFAFNASLLFVTAPPR